MKYTVLFLYVYCYRSEPEGKEADLRYPDTDVINGK